MRHPQVSNGLGENADPMQNGEGKTTLLVRDATSSLSVIRDLEDTDVVLLLSPLVPQVSEDLDDTSDPFECFGRALESRHSRIRHKPYTNSIGITSTHVGFIRLSKVVIIVVNGIEISGQTPHIDAAHVTRVAAGDDKPVIIVVTDCSSETWQRLEDFPTVIQSRDYSRASLERTVSVIFGEI
jgi:hypothetical protein